MNGCLTPPCEFFSITSPFIIPAAILPSMEIKKLSCTLLKFLAIILILSGPLFGLTSAGTITATIGDTIPLNGTVQLVDTVYLFVTGPGIPVNGARMDNSNAPVVTGDPGTFTQVMVENERWAYNWNTGRVSGGLAPGSHTVYVSTQPVAANALAGVTYAEIDILLKAAVMTGTLEVVTDPGDAEISLNGKYSGNSPRVFGSLAPGEYAIRLEKQGYITENGSITLNAGDTIQFRRSLTPISAPSTARTSTPVPTVTGEEIPLPPPTTAPLCTGMMIAVLIMACLFFKKRT